MLTQCRRRLKTDINSFAALDFALRLRAKIKINLPQTQCGNTLIKSDQTYRMFSVLPKCNGNLYNIFRMTDNSVSQLTVIRGDNI